MSTRIRRALMLAVVGASPPSAQRSKDPSVAIRQAAITDTVEKLSSYRIVADTAWAMIVDARDIGLMDPRQGVPGKEVRLERRGAAAAWARVSTKPVIIRPIHPKPEVAADTAAAAIPNPGPIPPPPKRRP